MNRNTCSYTQAGRTEREGASISENFPYIHPFLRPSEKIETVIGYSRKLRKEIAAQNLSSYLL